MLEKMDWNLLLKITLPIVIIIAAFWRNQNKKFKNLEQKFNIINENINKLENKISNIQIDINYIKERIAFLEATNIYTMSIESGSSNNLRSIAAKEMWKRRKQRNMLKNSNLNIDELRESNNSDKKK